MGLYAQTSPNGVYSTTETRPAVLEKPASREIMGGTVIRVNFDETNAISATQKGAFEYACRIWEENIPTTFPINHYRKVRDTAKSPMFGVRGTYGWFIRIGCLF